MLTLVAISSGSSNSSLRDDMGINKVIAPFSIASSATATGFGTISIEPPRFKAPTMMSLPFTLRSINPTQSAMRVTKLSLCPELACSPRLPEGYLINSRLLREKCIPIIIRNADKTFHLLPQGTLSNFCIKVPFQKI